MMFFGYKIYQNVINERRLTNEHIEQSVVDSKEFRAFLKEEKMLKP